VGAVLATFHPCAGEHGSAHQQGLLQDEQCHGGHHKAAVALGGVEQRHHLQLHWRAAGTGLLGALAAGLQLADFDACRHGAHRFGKAVLHSLVEQCIGTVGLDADHGTFTAHHTALEMRRDQHVAFYLATPQRLLRLALVAR
jgi:hypothetical protein